MFTDSDGDDEKEEENEKSRRSTSIAMKPEVAGEKPNAEEDEETTPPSLVADKKGETFVEEGAEKR